MANGMKMWKGIGNTTTLLFSLNRLMDCLLHDAIEGQMTEVKGVGRRRRTLLLDDLRNKRRYWELKEEAEDRKRWRQQFINRT